MVRRFKVNVMSGGTLFSLSPEELENPELYLEVFDPLRAFVEDAGTAGNDLPEDLAAALFFLREWQQHHGGSGLVQRCKARLEPDCMPV